MQTKYPNAVKFEQWLDKQIIYHFVLDHILRQLHIIHVINHVTETTSQEQFKC